ncbi:MAG: Asp-tRNA(Asn)/Glu-tRNA(Gln) amidotransferase subunit GatC [Clostridiales bacterium]|jgi:aspartyl-tRNA(Asn)/glutamyl-tRNA(Gln) amidotransferase subunit C|nr:Asp-tRNA(Asn)/Glu-tRNA(Gln) amidotransferase subunit GatC [Clostridiales bacterium]
MQLSEKEVTHIARLTRLRLGEAQTEKLRGELSRLIGYFAKLQEVDTAGVEPSYPHVLSVEDLRADVAVASMPRAQILANAPDRSEDAFRVPSVIE